MVIDLLNIEIHTVECAERLRYALGRIHAEACRAAYTGKGEGGEGGDNSEFCNAIHKGVLSSAVTVGCRAGDRRRYNTKLERGWFEFNA
jgi:hypothetical protein